MDYPPFPCVKIDHTMAVSLIWTLRPFLWCLHLNAFERNDPQWGTRNDKPLILERKKQPVALGLTASFDHKMRSCMKSPQEFFKNHWVDDSVLCFLFFSPHLWKIILCCTMKIPIFPKNRRFRKNHQILEDLFCGCKSESHRTLLPKFPKSLDWFLDRFGFNDVEILVGSREKKWF